MSYILTYKKKEFYPLSPKTEDIDIEDIAHALSLLCRANGHFKHFYSVGLHSLNCAYEAMARGYSENVVLGCLLHDGSEAYLADITRPVKKPLEWGFPSCSGSNRLNIGIGIVHSKLHYGNVESRRIELRGNGQANQTSGRKKN